MSIKPRLHNGETEEEFYKFDSEALARRKKERARLAPLLKELGVEDDPALGLYGDVLMAHQMNDLVLRVIQLERNRE